MNQIVTHKKGDVSQAYSPELVPLVVLDSPKLFGWPASVVWFYVFEVSPGLLFLFLLCKYPCQLLYVVIDCDLCDLVKDFHDSSFH